MIELDLDGPDRICGSMLGTDVDKHASGTPVKKPICNILLAEGGCPHHAAGRINFFYPISSPVLVILAP